MRAAVVAWVLCLTQPGSVQFALIVTRGTAWTDAEVPLHEFQACHGGCSCNSIHKVVYMNYSIRVSNSIFLGKKLGKFTLGKK